MSQQTNYGTVEAPAAVATPKRGGLIIALCLCTGGALFAVAGPAKAPRLRGSLPGARIKPGFAIYLVSTSTPSTRLLDGVSRRFVQLVLDEYGRRPLAS